VRRAPRTDYDAIAPSYDEDRKDWDIVRDDVVASGRVRDVLDVGCGTGLWLGAQASYFAGQPIAWTGIDLSAGMLAEAAVKGLRIVNASAETLPFRSGAFDYVYSSFAYHHFADKHAAFAETERVLRRLGVFRIRHIDAANMPRWWVYEFFPGTRDVDALRFWPLGDLRGALDALGFDVEVSTERVVERRTVQDILEEARRRVVSQLAILEDGDYDDGIARLESLEPAAVVSFDWAPLTLTARKRG
jgi:ubiquinone/menaquinone biosynthesis C-methylase UbiE